MGKTDGIIVSLPPKKIDRRYHFLALQQSYAKRLRDVYSYQIFIKFL